MAGPTTADGTDPDTDRSPPREAWGRSPSEPERGVSELLGAILLFGLLVAVMVLLQANAVPSQNERVEFDHNQRVQADVLELSSAADDVAATGRDRSAVLELAPEYPNRFLLLNPGRAQGRLSTSEADFSIENAVAAGETGEYWDGSEATFDSRALEYAPSYNVYQNAPDTTLAHGTVTDRFPDGTVTAIGGGSFVDGRRVSLVALDGQRSESRGGALSVELVPLSTETETVAVTDDPDDPDDPIVVRLQTDRTAAQWATILESELAPSGHVTDVRAGPGDTVEVELEQGVTYDLRLAKVGVGRGVTEPDPAYLTARDETSRTLESGSETTVTVQVRDAYNAPQSGVEVTFDESAGSLSGTTVVTDENGEATVTYTPGPSDATVTATIDGGTGAADDPRTVVYDVTVDAEGPGGPDDGQGSEPGDLNPGGTDALQLRDATLQGCADPNVNARSVELYDPDGDCRVAMTFQSAGQARTITAVRVSVFAAEQAYGIPAQGQGQLDPRPRPTEWNFQSSSFATVGGDRLTLTTPEAVPQGATVSYDFAFQRNGQRYNAVDGDLFVVTVRFDDGTISSYVVAPQG